MHCFSQNQTNKTNTAVKAEIYSRKNGSFGVLEFWAFKTTYSAGPEEK